MKEEYAYVLDFLPYGRPEKFIRNPIAHCIGEKYLILLEVSLKPNTKVDLKERIYIGSGFRDKVQRIIRRLKYDELSATAKSNLEEILPQIIKINEKRFIKIFNVSGPITTKMHSLELLSGIGKKTLDEILKERSKKFFESYEDFEKRTGIKDVEKIIFERILDELKEKDEYKLFVGNILI